jgi:hypothetical protein
LVAFGHHLLSTHLLTLQVSLDDQTGIDHQRDWSPCNAAAAFGSKTPRALPMMALSRKNTEEHAMRTIILVLLVLLTIPAATMAHHPPKPHPKIEAHKHKHTMKKAAQQCCRDQNPRHPNHQHKHHKK